METKCIHSRRTFSGENFKITIWKAAERVFTTMGTTTTTATPTKTSLENMTSRYLHYIVIIPSRSTCTMWPIYRTIGTELVGTTFKLRQRIENSPSFAHILHKTLNLVISPNCFAKDDEEM